MPKLMIDRLLGVARNVIMDGKEREKEANIRGIEDPPGLDTTTYIII